MHVLNYASIMLTFDGSHRPTSCTEPRPSTLTDPPTRASSTSIPTPSTMICPICGAPIRTTAGPASTAPARPRRICSSVDSPIGGSTTGAGHRRPGSAIWIAKRCDASAFADSSDILLPGVGGRCGRTGVGSKRVLRPNHPRAPNALCCAGGRRLAGPRPSRRRDAPEHASPGVSRCRDRHAGRR